MSSTKRYIYVHCTISDNKFGRSHKERPLTLTKNEKMKKMKIDYISSVIYNKSIFFVSNIPLKHVLRVTGMDSTRLPRYWRSSIFSVHNLGQNPPQRSLRKLSLTSNDLQGNISPPYSDDHPLLVLLAHLLLCLVHR